MLGDNLDSVRDRRQAYEDDRHEEWKRRWLRIFGATAAVLVLGLGAIAWWIFTETQRGDGSLARISGVEQSLGSLTQSAKDTDAKLSAWAGEREQLRVQLAQAGNDILSKAEAIKKQTGDAVDAMARKLQARTDGQVAALQSKITSLEVARETDQQQVASLQKQLGQVRGEVTKQGEDLVATRREMNLAGANTERQLASLNNATRRNEEFAQRNRQDVDQIANNLAVERVGFEVSKNKVQQLTPEISLNLTGVDIPYHRVSGWMWVLPDRRTIWLRNQSVQEPVIFYGHDDGKKRELVITAVTKGGMAGYLLLPKKAAPSGDAVAKAQ